MALSSDPSPSSSPASASASAEPALLVLAFFAASVGLLFVNAFWTRDGFSLVYFRQIVERPDYHEVFLRTVSISVVVALASAVLAYPIAWLLWRLPRWRNLLLVVVLVLPDGLVGLAKRVGGKGSRAKGAHT